MWELRSTADLCDRFGETVQVCQASLRSYGGIRSGSGRIATLRCFEDAGLLRQQLKRRGCGRILVVDAGASQRVAVLGDRMAGLAIANGWAGLVIHGAVRDVRALASLPLVVLALSHVPMRADSMEIGEVETPLQFGGVTFAPEQFICIDADGLIVLPEPPADLPCA